MVEHSSPDWQRLEDYAFADSANAGRWAWEFLRRNPGYRRDHARFMQTWRALEADYGSPPNRDFLRWKQDPRAWVPAEAASGGECRVDEDKVLIECALGAKYGFYKFPPDPADDDPDIEWRPLPETPPFEDCEGIEHGITLCFDPALPLRPQLEAAGRRLAARQASLRRQGLRMKRVRDRRDRWLACLRLLDAETAGASDEAIAVVLFDGDAAVLADCRREAHALRDGGYREIAFYPE